MSTSYNLHCLTCDEPHTWEKSGSAAYDWLVLVRDGMPQIVAAWRVIQANAPSDSWGFDLYDANGYRFDVNWLAAHAGHDVAVRDEYGIDD